VQAYIFRDRLFELDWLGLRVVIYEKILRRLRARIWLPIAWLGVSSSSSGSSEFSEVTSKSSSIDRSLDRSPTESQLLVFRISFSMLVSI